MAVRVIALLLAAVMMAVAVAQVCASPGGTSAVTSEIDDELDLDPAIVPAAVAVPLPDRGELAVIAVPRAPARGRRHAVVVFRPPRRVAQR